VQLEYFVDAVGELSVRGSIQRPTVSRHLVIGIRQSYHWLYRPELHGFRVDDSGRNLPTPVVLRPPALKSFHHHFRWIMRLVSHVAWMCQIINFGSREHFELRPCSRWRGMLLDRMMFELYRARDRCL